MTMRPSPSAKSHRLLAPRIAYLIGTRSVDGQSNLIPVSNATSISTDPQQVLLAVYKQWQTYENLSSGTGFTLSVPSVDHRDGVWILGARYSRFDLLDRPAKLRASGLSLIDDAYLPGPVLADGLGWIACEIRERLDFGGDHGVFVGEVVHVQFNDEMFSDDGTPTTDLRPLMQVTGNTFATADDTFTIPYGDR